MALNVSKSVYNLTEGVFVLMIKDLLLLLNNDRKDAKIFFQSALHYIIYSISPEGGHRPKYADIINNNNNNNTLEEKSMWEEEEKGKGFGFV